MEYAYGIATLNQTDPKATRRNWQLKTLLELSSEEYAECVKACSVLDTYRNDAQLFQIVIWNYEDYHKLLDEYLNAYIQKKEEVFLHRPPDLNINRCLMNFLASVRSYLDYIELNVKRKYGKTSSNAMKFKKYCSEAYDNSFSYRFLYKFRNYAQHCSLPLTRIRFSAKADGKDSETDHRVLEVGINRDELLEKHFDWGKIKQEVSEQPEIININDHLIKMMHSLKGIHSKYISDEFVTLCESAAYLKGLIEKIPSNLDELHLYRLAKNSADHSPEKIGLRMQVVPLDLIRDVFDERFAILFEEE